MRNEGNNELGGEVEGERRIGRKLETRILFYFEERDLGGGGAHPSSSARPRDSARSSCGSWPSGGTTKWGPCTWPSCPSANRGTQPRDHTSDIGTRSCLRCPSGESGRVGGRSARRRKRRRAGTGGGTSRQSSSSVATFHFRDTVRTTPRETDRSCEPTWACSGPPRTGASGASRHVALGVLKVAVGRGTVHGRDVRVRVQRL